MKTSAALVALVLAVTSSTSVWAHGVRPKHDGVVRSAGNLQFELVNNNGAAVIYVLGNHGEVVPTAGATGTLTITNGADKTEVALQPSGDNAMASKGDRKSVV